MVPSGEASFTVTLMRSPRLAIAPVEPPMPIIISTRRAPELSATSKEVCICIIVDFQLPIANLPLASAHVACPKCPSSRAAKSAIENRQLAMSLFRCLLHNLNYAPTLFRRQRPRLNYANAIAVRRAQLIMSHEFRRASHVTAVLAMQHQTIDSDDHRLQHFIG